MKPFLILALAALAHARPEAGYSYNAPAPAPQPSSSYGAPSGLGLSAGGLGGGHGGGHGGLGGGSSSFGSSGLGFSGISSGFSGSSFGGSQQAFSSGSSGSSFGGSSFSNGGSYSNGGSSFGGYQSQAPLISKHVYVHVAPEEPEVRAPARINAPTQARKHYKIVFIKAPTPPTPTQQTVELPPQDEEKTLIYVLVKKPEEQPEVKVNVPPPTPPSKPEVYFIKYKAQKEEGYPNSIAPAPANPIHADDGIITDARGASGIDLPIPAAPSSSYGTPSGPARSPSSSYGTPL